MDKHNEIQYEAIIRNQAMLISNKSENACPFPELKMGRATQWAVIVRMLKDLGYTVVDTKQLAKLDDFHSAIQTAILNNK
jgi:hypothetical protein